MNALKGISAATILIASGLSHAQTGLPWSSGFETGDLSEWNGYSRGQIEITEQDPNSGQYCARVNLDAGSLNNNYVEHYFGDHVQAGLEKVEEVYLVLHSKFSSGYEWPDSQSHKIALLNLTDGAGDRRYQVYIFVDSNGEYVVDHSYIDNWQFHALRQNVGDPVSVQFDQWDRLKLRVRLNTPGQSDGVVQLWLNGTLKLDHRNVNIRENTEFGINKLILSSYTSHESGGSGVQWYDGWSLSEQNPSVDDVAPSPPTIRDVQ